MTNEEKIAELQELRAITVESIKKATRAQAYSASGNSKQMASVKDLREQLKDIDRDISKLQSGRSGIDISYGVPE